MSPRRRPALLTSLLVAAVLPVPGAAAQTTPAGTSSSNWAGYAATGANFRRVSASWRVPRVDCSSGEGYSANWVGLGGYSTTSRALEQAGTESDCSRTGRATYSAWWEVVPDVAHTASITVRPGDRMVASVAVTGHRVTMRVADVTRGTAFTRVVDAAAVDVSSAEWILEAPATCSSSDTSSCSTLPLADFGTSAFSSARAVTRGGHRGTISDARWRTTAITLNAASDTFRGPRPEVVAATGAIATPGALSVGGGGFAIVFGQGTAVTTTQS